MVAAADAGVAAVVVETEMADHSFQIQWHITDQCNLRCRHCYSEGFDTAELPLEKLRELLNGFVEFIESWRHGKHFPSKFVPAKLTITGGEPFLRADFFELLQEVATLKSLFRFAILTNGILIDRVCAKRLAKLKPHYVQVSIDGLKEAHEAIRGPGSYNPALEGIKHLVQAGIPTSISFTAQRRNLGEFTNVAKLGIQLGVIRVWADRMIPCLNHSGNSLSVRHSDLLSPLETRSFFHEMESARNLQPRNALKKLTSALFGGKEAVVSMNRALQFLTGGGPIYHCCAARTLVAVLADGSLVPCRRMPIPVGNLFETSLLQLYRESGIFQQLRETSTNNERCRKCVYLKGCGGGLRCLAYALTGGPLFGDPDCWV